MICFVELLWLFLLFIFTYNETVCLYGFNFRTHISVSFLVKTPSGKTGGVYLNIIKESSL